MIIPIQCFIGQVVILLVWYLICALLYPIIKNKKQIKVLDIVNYSMYILLMTYRPINLNDTQVYFERFNKIDPYKVYEFRFGREATTDFEYMFVYFIQLVKRIGGNFRVFNFLITIILLLLLVKGVKKIAIEEKTFNTALFLAIVLSNFGIYYNAVVLRGALAISFTFYAFSTFSTKKGNKILGYIGEGVGFLFQRMGILGWSLPVLYKMIPVWKKKSTYLKIWFGIFLVWIIEYKVMLLLKIFRKTVELVASIVPVLANYANYLAYSYQEGILFLLIEIAYIINILYLVCYKRNSKCEDKILGISLVGGFVLSIGMRFKFITRITDFFLIVLIPLNYLINSRFRPIKRSNNGVCISMQYMLLVIILFMYLVPQIRAITYYIY